METSLLVAGGFESPETVTCSPGCDPGILSATQEDKAVCFMQQMRRWMDLNQVLLFVEILLC